jgi:exonuclease III
MTTLKLLTFNIYGKHCSQFDDFEGKIITPHNPDIICTQESINHTNSTKLGSYNSIDSAGHGGEIVGVFSNDESKKYITAIEKISTDGSKNKVADRHAILFNYKGVTIANLHLEGGRFSDQQLFNNFNDLMRYKLELLSNVIAKKPDIILGDFNSVYSSNMEKMNEYLKGQYTYFQNYVLKQATTLKDEQKKTVDSWNAEPYNLLLKSGYVYAIPDNETSDVTNGRGNSIIDTVWYKRDSINLTNSHIITTILNKGDNYNAGHCISDHNPVYVEFQISKLNPTKVNTPPPKGNTPPPKGNTPPPKGNTPPPKDIIPDKINFINV